MAETWAKNRRGRPLRGDPFTRIDALAARRVLRDAYRARHELAQAFKSRDAAVCRLRWVTAVTLLRAVGHALDSIDTRRSPVMKQAVKTVWKRWQDAPFHHLIFHQFIKRERDVVLKEYRFTEGRVTAGDGDAAGAAVSASTIILIGDRSYSALDTVDAALAWWEAEIAKVEDEAGHRQTIARQA
jgi:hypothetical protein